MAGTCLHKIAAMLCILAAFTGCTVAKPKPAPYSASIVDVLSGKGILGHEVSDSELPDYDLFSLTPEMEDFAKKAVRSGENYFDKVKNLQVALLSSTANGRGIVYNAYITEVPKVTFEQRRANCLSFTLLYVALARAVGIDAEVNEVEIPPTWDLRNKNMVFLRHVNVKVYMARNNPGIFNGESVIIDLEMSRYRSTYNQHTISDIDATAQFYSNRATEYLETNNFVDAFLNLRKSIHLNDQQSYVWSNLGALYSRKSLWREAELAYLHGLELNPDDLTVMNNLSYLYRQMGNKELAQKYSRIAQRYREYNPYYKYNFSLSAFEHGDYDSALQFISRAIEREKNDARFYELAARIYEKQGRTSKMESMLRKVKKLKPDGLQPHR